MKKATHGRIDAKTSARVRSPFATKNWWSRRRRTAPLSVCSASPSTTASATSSTVYSTLWRSTVPWIDTLPLVDASWYARSCTASTSCGCGLRCST